MAWSFSNALYRVLLRTEAILPINTGVPAFTVENVYSGHHPSPGSLETYFSFSFFTSYSSLCQVPNTYRQGACGITSIHSQVSSSNTKPYYWSWPRPPTRGYGLYYRPQQIPLTDGYGLHHRLDSRPPKNFCALHHHPLPRCVTKSIEAVPLTNTKTLDRAVPNNIADHHLGFGDRSICIRSHNLGPYFLSYCTYVGCIQYYQYCPGHAILQLPCNNCLQLDDL